MSVGASLRVYRVLFLRIRTVPYSTTKHVLRREQLLKKKQQRGKYVYARDCARRTRRGIADDAATLTLRGSAVLASTSHVGIDRLITVEIVAVNDNLN